MPFDLRTEPWIPVLFMDGNVDRIGLLDLFSHAVEIRMISTELPTQRFALQRVLLAILHRSFMGPQTLEEWLDISSRWDLYQSPIRQYLDQWSSRFDLLHPKTPFMQIADLRTSRDEVFSLERLIMDVPNNQRKLFSTRANQGISSMSYADAALWLINSQAYDESGIKSGAVGDPRVKGGRGYPIGTGWAGQLQGVQAVGASLKETLMLNLLVPGASGGSWSVSGYSFEGTDVPSWERDLTAKPRHSDPSDFRSNYADGFLDLYTWQARRIKLIDDGQQITHVLLANGDKFLPQNSQYLEPQSTFRHSAPQSDKAKIKIYMPGTMTPNHTVWRGLSSMLAESQTVKKETHAVVRPAVLEFIGALKDQKYLNPEQHFRLATVAVEYGPNSSTYTGVFGDHLDLPLSLAGAGSAQLRDLALEGISRIEMTAFALYVFGGELALSAGDKNPDSAKEKLREKFFESFDATFRDWLMGLTSESSRAEQLAKLDQLTMRAVSSLASEEVSYAPQSALAGRPDPQDSTKWLSAGSASRKLHFQVRKVLDHLPKSLDQEVAIAHEH